MATTTTKLPRRHLHTPPPHQTTTERYNVLFLFQNQFNIHRHQMVSIISRLDLISSQKSNFPHSSISYQILFFLGAFGVFCNLFFNNQLFNIKISKRNRKTIAQIPGSVWQVIRASQPNTSHASVHTDVCLARHSLPCLRDAHFTLLYPSVLS